MASEGTHIWSGKSGREYVYRVYKLPPRLKKLPGNYIFAKPTEVKGWIPVYIGQTENLGETLNKDHPALACVRKHEATHVHAHENAVDEEGRNTEVEDLVRVWNPPCTE